MSSLTGGGGITVSSSTGEVTLGTSSIPYASLNLSSSIVGADLASGINISTTGNIATTGTGSITSAGLLTASNGLTLSAGALSFPANSIADSYLSTNVALLTGIQTFTGSKTFASALLAPTSTNTINGLIINSGALSGITTIALSGALSGATTITGSGNINTTGGSLQTNGVIRIDNSGNLTAGTGTFGGAVSGITTLSLGGNLTFSTDNAFDIGAAGATRPRNIYTASNIYLPNAVAISGRNAANSAWIDLVKYDASNNLVLGGSGGVGVVQPVNDGGWDFGTASLRWGSGFFGGSVRIGTNPASTGNLRLPNAATISQRNAGNTADEAIWPIENTTCAPPSNQSIGTANTWVDACSVTLTAGTWFITAAINISTTSQSSHRGRIYNSTDAASVQETISYISSAVGDNDTLPIVAILTITGTKTIKLQGTSDGTTGTILQNATNPGGGGTTRMVAVRLGY